MTRAAKNIVAILGIIVILMLIVPAMTMGSGSPWLARRWMKQFSKVHDIATAKDDAKLFAHEFPDGSWLCGKTSPSHGNPWGGTIVTKDSSGAVRVFFGHVCAGGELALAIRNEDTDSLEQAYSNLVVDSRFVEQHLK